MPKLLLLYFCSNQCVSSSGSKHSGRGSGTLGGWRVDGYSSPVCPSTSRGCLSCLPKNVSKKVGASKRQNAPKTKDAERLTLDCNHPPIEGPILKPMLHVTE